MSVRKYFSICLTSHFKNRVGKTALTKKKKKITNPEMIHIAGGNCSYLCRERSVS